MGAMYMVPILAVDYSAANAPMDLLEIVPAANQLVIIHELLVGQIASETSEALLLELFYGYTASGSGGATPTPEKLSQQFAAWGGTTMETGNTTPAGTGGAQMGSIAWNALNGVHYLPTPEARIQVTGSDRFVFHLPIDPAVDLTLDGYAIIEVLGG